MKGQNRLKNATVAISGGTGSFGSNMAKHLLQKDIAEIRIFSRDEAKQDSLRHQLKDERVRFLIGDVRDQQSVRRAIKGADFVFHAAALKQVPTAEFFPLEAVKTNILGSSNVLRSSMEESVKGVVFLSTDKAVYPINAMGMTKALMERTAQSFARDFPDSETTISVTRYGNVMYSRGSVIPLFISQIRNENKITITDPNMTRFLMSLADSIDLVEYAFKNARSGDLFVKKAPAATIQTLADALVEIFGDRNTEARVIGFRHGEKLYESLLGSEEKARSEDLGDFFRVPMDTRDLNYSSFFDSGSGNTLEEEPYTSHNTERLDLESTKRLLLGLPEVKSELARL